MRFKWEFMNGNIAVSTEWHMAYGRWHSKAIHTQRSEAQTAPTLLPTSHITSTPLHGSLFPSLQIIHFFSANKMIRMIIQFYNQLVI